MRSAKYFFTSGGIRMFAMPTPAKTSAVAITSVTAFTATPRAMSPSVTALSAMTATRSRPSRRSKSGVSRPNSAKHTGGAVPIRPMIAGESGKSRPIRSTTGDSEATAERSENAHSTIPSTARVRPCQSGRVCSPPAVTRSATPRASPGTPP